MCSLQKKKFLLPSSVINFLPAGQQKTKPPRGICAWPSVGRSSTVYLRSGLSTLGVLLHWFIVLPLNVPGCLLTIRTNILSFVPRTVFLNKWGEALRRNRGIGILNTEYHSIWQDGYHTSNKKFKCELSQITRVCLDFSPLNRKMGCTAQYPVSSRAFTGSHSKSI